MVQHDRKGSQSLGGDRVWVVTERKQGIRTEKKRSVMEQSLMAKPTTQFGNVRMDGAHTKSEARCRLWASSHWRCEP